MQGYAVAATELGGADFYANCPHDKAVLVIGSMMLLDRIRGRRWLTEGDDPNIIDAL